MSHVGNASPVAAHDAPAERLVAWVTLTKPRIGAFVMLSALVGALLGAGTGVDLLRALEASFWVLCTAASANVFNQVLERDVDARMRRTASRPLVTGAVSARDAVLFGALLATAGVVGLAVRFNLLAALLGLASLVAYALVYTPLKRLSTLNTVVGALPGAMPPLLGHVALTGQPGAWGWMLFAMLFAWQFPHFMAIAWLYREDYARAGLRMLPAVEGTRGLAGRQALMHALVLLPITLLPAARGDAGWVYAAGALVLGGAYALASLAFALREDRPRARVLLVISLFYLPLMLSLTLIDPRVRLVLGT